MTDVTSQGTADFPAHGAALVIGGTGGLGSTIVRGFAARGVNVAFTYHSRREPAVALADELSNDDCRLQAYSLDLMDRDSIVAAVAAAAADFGGIHTVVYAAGAALYLRYMGQIEPERMAYHVQSDVMGFFHVVQATLPHVREMKGSYVACCSSGLDKWPIKDALSIVPKSAVATITRGIAREEGRFGIRANIVGTGVINAGITLAGLASGDVPESFIKGAAEMTPLGRIGEGEDIAEAVLFLASHRAKFITGQNLNVDGGWGT